jgi:hypothetical protein
MKDSCVHPVISSQLSVFLLFLFHIQDWGYNPKPCNLSHHCESLFKNDGVQMNGARETRLVFPVGILNIPVFSAPVAFFSQESRFLFPHNFFGMSSGNLSIWGLRRKLRRISICYTKTEYNTILWFSTMASVHHHCCAATTIAALPLLHRHHHCHPHGCATIAIAIAAPPKPLLRHHCHCCAP